MMCGNTLDSHPKRNDPDFGNRMVSAHCYDELDPEAAFLITTCHACNMNGRKDDRYFECLRDARIKYLYDSDGNRKGKGEYLGHGRKPTPHTNVFTRQANHR